MRSASKGSQLQRHPPASESIASNEGQSWSTPRSRRDACTTGKPLRVGLESDAELLVIDAQIAVATAHHRLRLHGLHFLRDNTDIGLVAAEIAEAVEAEPIGEMAKQ